MKTMLELTAAAALMMVPCLAQEPAAAPAPAAPAENPSPAPAAAVPAAPADPDLPQPFNNKSLDPLIVNGPFNRAVNLSDSLVLTGMAAVDGKPMVTLMDKAQKRTYVVTDEPNENGWKLAEPPPKVALKKAQVKINMGSEVVTIRHDSESQEESMKKDKHAPGGAPGRPDSKDDRGYHHGRGGPSDEQRERFNNLSDTAKEKVRDLFRQNRDRLMGMTDEQRRAFLESNFKNISEADQASRNGK